MKNNVLYRDKKTYLKLMILTNITGAYNFYLGKDRKALNMIFVWLLCIFTTPFFIFPIIGIFINMYLFIMDFRESENDINIYNKNIKSILDSDNKNVYLLEFKSKNIEQYKKSILLFSILGLEDFYLDNFNTNSFRFIISRLYFIIIELTNISLVTLSIFSIVQPLDQHLILSLIFMINMVALIISVMIILPILLIITFCRIYIKFSNANQSFENYINKISEIKE